MRLEPEGKEAATVSLAPLISNMYEQNDFATATKRGRTTLKRASFLDFLDFSYPHCYKFYLLACLSLRFVML